MAATFTADIDSRSFEYPPKIGGTAGNSVSGVLSLGNPYATGGVAVTAATFRTGATTLRGIIFDSTSRNGLISATLNAATNAVLAKNLSGIEIAAAVNLSAAGFNIRCIVFVE